jgi:DNA processing protein
MQSTPGTAVDGEELRCWLALHRIPHIGARRFVKLLSRFGSAARVFSSPDRELQAAGVPSPCMRCIRAPDWRSVERDLEWLDLPDHHLIRFTDAAYPHLLLEIADPPGMVFVRGDAECLLHPQVAIVGSRNPSHGGRTIAAQLSSRLVGCGLTVTSGLASGIDGAAHRGALEAQGHSVAVAGTGLDRVYPSHHRELAEAIAFNGALISEFPPGTAPLPANFPRRNRIISGLSLGTVVVEAALRSGSLITARTALDQGREVFAVPGSIHNPLTRGCHALIREGAKLVETAQDILEELALQVTVPSASSASTPACTGSPSLAQQLGGLAPEYSQLLEYMGHDPVSVDQLVERSGLTPEEVSSMLLILELGGHLVPDTGARYSRVR